MQTAEMKAIPEVRRRKVWAYLAPLALVVAACGGSGGGPNLNLVSRMILVKDIAGNVDLYAVNLDGTDEVRLTNDPAIDEKARWSPDRSIIVFVRRVLGDGSVHTMSPSGLSVTNLTPGETSFDPRWLTTGRIVCAIGDGTASEIVTMDADGTNRVVLTTDAIRDVCPSASPDGGTIAYMKEVAGTHEIWLMNTDGTNKRLLVGGLVIGSIAWSPDSQRVAYVTDRTGNRDIFVINVDGSSDTQVTTDPASDFGVLWSEDGDRMMFTSDRDGNNEIYTMGVDGTDVTRHTNNSYSDVATAWRPPVQ